VWERAAELPLSKPKGFTFNWESVRRHARQPEAKKGLDKKAAGSDTPHSATA